MSDDYIYTTSDAADMLKIARRTVTKWCALLGMEKVGRDYILTMDELRAIKRNCYMKRGRPKKDD
jgi:hypothetical protein